MKTVYLDTQDYISLFNEGVSGPKHKVLGELLEMRDKGLVVFGFSFATVAEFITKPAAGFREDRVRRGALIKHICGNNAFPYLGDLARGATFPNDGYWMPRSRAPVVTAKKFRKDAEKIFLEKLSSASHLNRRERRKFRKMGYEAMLRMAGHSWGRSRSDYAGLPVSEELIQSRLLERFLKGDCSDKEFEERVSRWYCDPEEFSRIYYDYGDKPNIVDGVFGEAIDGFEKTLVNVEEVFKKVAGYNAKIQEAREELIRAGVDKKEARQITKPLPIPKAVSENVESKLDEILGEGRAAHIRHYVSQVMSGSYKPKRSDLMDLVQMVYAYDCDLFRCDKGMAATMRGFIPFKDKLVSRFEDLPARISSV